MDNRGDRQKPLESLSSIYFALCFSTKKASKILSIFQRVFQMPPCLSERAKGVLLPNLKIHHMCAFEGCVCLCVRQCVLIPYPYLQIWPSCLSDPCLPTHLISPSFCPPDTLLLRVSVWVFSGLICQNIVQSNQFHVPNACISTSHDGFNPPLQALLSPWKD